MNPTDHDGIHALRTDVAAGFAEMRSLMEARRVEDTSARAEMDVRLRQVERVAYTTKVMATSGLVLFGTVFGGILYIVK